MTFANYSYRNLFTSILFVLFFVLISGCLRMGVNLLGTPMVSHMVKNISQTGNVRLVKEGLAGQVLLATSITEMSPDNIDLLTETSFLYCAYGLFIEDDDPEYAKELYSLGKEYGIRALKQDYQFKKGLESGEKISVLANSLSGKYADALCWTGINGGLFVILNLDDPGALIELADIITMVKRSITLNEDYFHGVGKVFLGAYYALVPSYLGLGGGEENSRKMFQEARKISDNRFLLVDLFEARFLATTIEDESLFDRKLNQVLSADPSVLKQARLINELSKVKARYYLLNKSNYF
jgi:hypothetical protein